MRYGGHVWRIFTGRPSFGRTKDNKLLRDAQRDAHNSGIWSGHQRALAAPVLRHYTRCTFHQSMARLRFHYTCNILLIRRSVQAFAILSLYTTSEFGTSACFKCITR